MDAHKRGVEGILGGVEGVRLLAPSRIGAPTAAQVTAATRTKDLEDVLTFNLLGVHGSTGNVRSTAPARSRATSAPQRPR